MAQSNEIKGATGILYLKKSGEFKPIVCLTSTSISRVANVIEKINYCTGGETHKTIDKIDKTVNFDAILMDDDTNAGYMDLIDAMETMQEQVFKIEGRQADEYFTAVISNLSDTFPGDGSATFSGTLEINGTFESTDPAEG